MRLSKNDVQAPWPYPPQTADGDRERLFAAFPKSRRPADAGAAEPTAAAPRQVVADLIDLVANRRADLLRTLLDALDASEPTRTHAGELMDQVASCGVAEAVSPCATAAAIAADLEQLARSGDRWTHPAQIVRRPDVQGLFNLCAALAGRETGPARERLEKILPRLERAARLTEKAASRRVQEASRQQPAAAERATRRDG